MASSDQKGALADFINADMIDLKEVLRAHQKRQDKAQEGEMGSFYRESTASSFSSPRNSPRIGLRSTARCAGDKYRSRYIAPVDSAINVQQQTMPAAQSQMGRSQNNNQMALQNTESQNNMSQNTQSGARARSNVSENLARLSRTLCMSHTTAVSSFLLFH